MAEQGDQGVREILANALATEESPHRLVNRRGWERGTYSKKSEQALIDLVDEHERIVTALDF